MSFLTEQENNPLYHAVLDESAGRIKRLLEEGISVNNNYATYSPLHYAVLCGSLDVIKLLLDSGADVGGRSRGLRQTPVHWAAKWGTLESLKLLVDEDQYSLTVQDGTSDKNEPIHIAAIYGRTDVVSWLISKEVHVDKNNESGLTPLFLAVLNGQRKLVKYLICNGASLDIINYNMDDMTPLHAAVKLGHARMVKTLVKNKADARTVCRIYKYNPVHWAAKLGELDCLVFMEQEGISMTTPTSDLKADLPIHIAVREGHLSVVKFLLHKGVSIESTNVFGTTPLHYAVLYNKIDIVSYLLGKGADVDAQMNNRRRNTPLHIGAEVGNFDLLTLLLEYGADANAAETTKYTAMHFVVEQHRLDLMTQLENFGADPYMYLGDEDGETLIVTAAKNDSLEIAEWLLTKYIPVGVRDSAGMTPLHYAAFHSSSNVAKLLVSKGADINAKDKTECEMTPIHYAVLRGYTWMAEFLAKSGADLNIETASSNATPLHLAAMKGTLGCLQVMAVHGGDILTQPRCDEGDLPIHTAAKHGHLNVVEWLMNQHGFVDVRNLVGYTPLLLAASGGHVKTARFLMENGADWNTCSFYTKRSALHLAVQNRHPDVVELLLSYNADTMLLDQFLMTPADWARTQNHEKIRALLERSIKKIPLLGR